jgi:mono/diheme cytochrome c family protein
MKPVLFIRAGVGLVLLSLGCGAAAQPWSVPVGGAPTNRPTAAPVLVTTPVPAGVLAVDADQKEVTITPPDYTGQFVFHLTNISQQEFTLTFVQTTCGCTVPKIQWPMKIGPGGHVEIPISMDVRGKTGVVTKGVTIYTDRGQKVVLVKATILPGDNTMGALDRERNQQLALADPQAIFKGDCARCHVEPVIGKMGKELYTTACGICHEAEHRATMVPDLHALKVTPNAEYWRLFITQGKPGTLMPGFAQAKGGPLSEMQVNSLVDYLVKEFPHSKTNAPAAH